MMKWSGFKKNGFLPESSAYALGWAKLSFMPKGLAPFTYTVKL